MVQITKMKSRTDKLFLSTLLLTALACADRSQPASNAGESASPPPTASAETSTDSNATPQPISSTDATTSDTATQFVKDFYDWYVPLTAKWNSEPTWSAVLRERKSSLAPELAKALEDDLAAQAEAIGEIVGIDFDPFVSGQDPCSRYEVAATVERGESFWVDIHSVCDGRRSEEPDVVAEVVRHDGRWVFTNVHYPGVKSHLRSILGM